MLARRQEKQLEFAVIEILERANAADYVATFARHRITIETMRQMTEDDLKQVTMATRCWWRRGRMFRSKMSDTDKDSETRKHNLENI